MSPVRPTGEGVALAVRVSPRASKNSIDGIRTDADGTERLVVKVTAPPDKGKANAAVIKLLAKATGVAPGQITVTAGETSRSKTIVLKGETKAIMDQIGKNLRELEHG